MIVHWLSWFIGLTSTLTITIATLTFDKPSSWRTSLIIGMVCYMCWHYVVTTYPG